MLYTKEMIGKFITGGGFGHSNAFEHKLTVIQLKKLKLFINLVMFHRVCQKKSKQKLIAKRIDKKSIKEVSKIC